MTVLPDNKRDGMFHFSFYYLFIYLFLRSSLTDVPRSAVGGGGIHNFPKVRIEEREVLLYGVFGVGGDAIR